MEKSNKQKSTLIRDAIALFLITLISGLALSFIYEVTKAPIEQQLIEKNQKANKEVFPEAASFTLDEEQMNLVQATDLTTLNTDYTGVTINEINKAYDANNELLGYNVMVTTTTGYKDPITIIFGYSLAGEVKGAVITSINETAGLGMKAKDADFIGQFENKQVEQFVVTKTGSTSDDQIDAISGATITSRAVTNAINTGIGFVSKFATENGGGQ